jgi:uncharacterized protein YkwD
MRRILAAVLAAAVLVSVNVLPATAHDGLIWATNRFRLNHGLPWLWTNDNLDRLAHQRARQIVGDGFFHRFDWVNQTHCEVGGENLAYRMPALDSHRIGWFMDAWRDSPTHRDMMLGRGWKRMGAAIYVAPDGAMYGVQLFCNPR